MESITKKISNTEVEISYLNVLPSGHGHYKVNGEAYINRYNSIKISFTTSNMPAIDALKSDNEAESLEIALGFQEQLFDKNENKINEFVAEFEKEQSEED